MSYSFPDSGSPFPYEPERKQRGCLFYGCIFSAVLLGLILLLIGLASWATYRALDQAVQQFAEDAPAPIPVTEKPAAELDAIKARVRQFSESLEAGKPTEPLEVTADEINAWIATFPGLRGVAAIELVDGNIRGKVSLPIERLGFPINTLFKGKYLNGTATIDAHVIDGRPAVMLVGLEAKGKRVPDSFLTSIRGPYFAQDIDEDGNAVEAIGRLKSIEVKDGKLILTPKPAGKEEPEAKKDGPTKAKDEAKPDGPGKAADQSKSDEVKAKDQPKSADRPAEPK